VTLTVLGVPPDQTVIPWDEGTIGGVAATSVLDQTTRRRIGARVGPLWPPGPIALAAAAAKTIEAVLSGFRLTISAFVAPDHSAGQRFKSAALPVRLGLDGVTPVEPVRLSAHERVALENAISL
jgi:malate/lactate dehydrogenase